MASAFAVLCCRGGLVVVGLFNSLFTLVDNLSVERLIATEEPYRSPVLLTLGSMYLENTEEADIVVPVLVIGIERF